jgi:hypothetical protein
LYLGFTVLWISSDILQGKGAGGLDDDDEEPDEDEEEEEP